ncbi:MAG: glycosyltransferase family 2 protein [Sphingomicrobium sp.]
MRLSLGIFAHNEEQNLSATLASLFRQSLLGYAAAEDLNIRSFELLCLANGCNDQTVEVARRHSQELPPDFSYRVIDLPEGGKARTWNSYVHELSDSNADFLFLMDADIIFEGDDVLEQLLRELLANQHAQIATDTPIKSFRGEEGSLSIMDRGSLAASDQKSKRGVLCGQLYGARAQSLRTIWLPPALPVEDGFIAAMISTVGFTSEDDVSRIAWVPTARHFFRTHRSISGFISHEARIIVGSTINSWLFSVLWEEGRKGHVGTYVQSQNRTDGEWLARLIDYKVFTGGRWLIPAHFMLWRLTTLRGQPLPRKLRLAPIALAATALNFVACVRANAILKRGNAAAHW